MIAIIEVEKVNKAFRSARGMWATKNVVPVAIDVSFAVKQGSVLAIVGESGSGKTTLARMLLGLIKPDSGEIKVCGEHVAQTRRNVLTRRVQPVFQDPYSSLNPAKSIATIIGLPYRVAGIGDSAEERRSVLETMDMVGLSRHLADRLPAELSGGQRQRVAIARALISRPKILICDEPTSALDISVQAQILNLLDDLRASNGLTYVIISHNMAVVEHLASEVIVMRDGRIVEMGGCAELFSAPQNPYTKTLISASLITTEMWH